MEYTIKTYSRLPDRQQWRKDREYVGSANGRTQGTESGVWEFWDAKINLFGQSLIIARLASSNRG